MLGYDDMILVFVLAVRAGKLSKTSAWGLKVLLYSCCRSVI